MQTTHPAADIQAAVKKTLTSAAFARFMGQAVQTALAEVQAQADTTIVLAGQPLGWVRFVEAEDHRYYYAHSADKSCEVHMQCDRTPSRPEHRGSWYGRETRTDASGQQWSRSLPRMVQNDFGFLVEVAR